MQNVWIDSRVPDFCVDAVENSREFVLVFLKVFMQPAAKISRLYFPGVVGRHSNNLVSGGDSER